MEELVEDYDLHKPLIEVLSVSIERWEDESEEFSDFNAQIENLDNDVAALRTIMCQYQLKADDMKKIIGGRSLVSMILNGTRKLTKDHIQALSSAYNLNPAIFFSV